MRETKKVAAKYLKGYVLAEHEHKGQVMDLIPILTPEGAIVEFEDGSELQLGAGPYTVLA